MSVLGHVSPADPRKRTRRRRRPGPVPCRRAEALPRAARDPRGLRFSTSAFVARMPISMLGLGVVLLVVSETGRYGRAGALSATFALAEAARAPLVSRLVDRRGQSTGAGAGGGGAPRRAHRVRRARERRCAAVDAVPDGRGGRRSPLPSIGSLVRARWGFVLGDDPRLHRRTPRVGAGRADLRRSGRCSSRCSRPPSPRRWRCSRRGCPARRPAPRSLLTHRASEPPPSAHARDHPSALRSTGLPVLMLVMVFVGGVFGAVEISAVAFADEHGHRAWPGRCWPATPRAA